LESFANCIQKINLHKGIDIQKLIKAKYQDNLEFLQWFNKYYLDNYTGTVPYDAVEKRNKAIAEYPFQLKATGRRSSTVSGTSSPLNGTPQSLEHRRFSVIPSAGYNAMQDRTNMSIVQETLKLENNRINKPTRRIAKRKGAIRPANRTKNTEHSEQIYEQPLQQADTGTPVRSDTSRDKENATDLFNTTPLLLTPKRKILGEKEGSNIPWKSSNDYVHERVAELVVGLQEERDLYLCKLRAIEELIDRYHDEEIKISDLINDISGTLKSD